MAGAQHPRKDTTSKSTRLAIESAAVQIGLVLAIERNRWRLNQSDFAGQFAGVTQGQISLMERGKPARLTNAQLDQIFRWLEMSAAMYGVQKSFLKWWQSQ